MDESVSQFHMLCMRLRSQSWAELFNTPRVLGVGERALRDLALDRQRLVQEAAERYTEAVRKVNTARESDMARTPYVTVRGTEPAPPAPKPKETPMPTEYERRSLSPDPVPQEPEKAEKEDTGPPAPDPVEFDVEKANDLLDLVLNCKDLPTLSPLSGSAMQQLVKMAKEVADETAKLQEEWRAAYAEWENKKKKEAEEKRKKEEEKEKAA